jgi:hypothetical protein
MGLRSNFSAMTSQGRSGVIQDPSDHVLAAAQRSRQIKHRLDRAGPWATSILFLAYGKPPPHNLEQLGVVAGLLGETGAAQEAFHQSRSTRKMSDWLSRLLDRQDDPEVRLIILAARREAEGMLLAASKLYGSASRSERR